MAGDRGTRPGRLAGHAALVTGATAGIGKAIAARFAEEGASVVVHGLDPTDAAAAARDISRGGSQAVGVAADLAAAEAPEQLAQVARDAFGPLDILVNNAALKTRGDLASTGAAAFDEMIAVNLRAPLLLVRALMGHFRERGRGAVLNIGSVNAYCGEANLLAYSVSKGGLMTLSRNLADALAPEGVRVNQLNVGWVLTESEDELCRARGFPQGWADRLPKVFAPTGTLLSPDDIAHYALAFVEDAGWRVSGAVVELEQYPVVGRNPPKDLGLLK